MAFQTALLHPASNQWAKKWHSLHMMNRLVPDYHESLHPSKLPLSVDGCRVHFFHAALTQDEVDLIARTRQQQAQSTCSAQDDRQDAGPSPRVSAARRLAVKRYFRCRHTMSTDRPVLAPDDAQMVVMRKAAPRFDLRATGAVALPGPPLPAD